MTHSVLKMATTPLFILLLCLFGSAYAQETAFKPEVKKGTSFDAPHKGQKELTEILVQLELVYDVTFAYQKKFLSGKYATYRPLFNTDIDSYLKEILIPLKLDYKKIGNSDEEIYVISPITETPVSAKTFGTEHDSTALADDKAMSKVIGFVKGTVDGKPISGVNVLVKGTTNGTTTDSEGKFSVYIPANTKVPLLFSFIGFQSKEVEVSESKPVLIWLDEQVQCLSELVITSLGIERDQKALGYSIGTVDADLIVDAGNTNFGSALYGKIPGIKIRTAPGGATSAVTIQIRGFTSLNYNTQPLYILNGVPIRDGNENGGLGINNDGYYTDQRVRGNGILDISPEDIETLTALKGASATALYGSDASNGVIVITTKKGMKPAGMGVDINYNFSIEKVAFTPKYQNLYGPGYDRTTNLALGASAEGWVPVDVDNDGNMDGVRPLFRAYGQFGPKMEGQQVYWWDGTLKTYSPQPNNYNDFYRTGFNSQFNIAIYNQFDKGGYRFSYSRNEYEGIQVGGKLKKNFISLNTSFKLSNRLQADWALNFTNSFVHNRPYKINRLMDSYNGFFSRAEKMSLFFDKYKTSAGYKWVPPDQAQRNPDEALKFSTPRGYEVMNLLWRQLRDSEDEKQNRLISSFSMKYDITKGLNLRGRLGNDITYISIETKQHNEYPTQFNTSSSTGSYGKENGTYSILYGDLLLSYTKNLNNNITMGINTGLQVRDELYRSETTSTTGGLTIENQFDFTNSYNDVLTKIESDISILKYAYLGILNFSYKNFIFLEGTGRKEYSSTLPASNNSYFYPSINTSFVFSDVIPLPSFFNYGKLRASYGVVGNAPPVYEANILYDMEVLPTANGPVTSGSSYGNLYGNDNIRPELKKEVELGIEVTMLNKKVDLDFTYYTNRIEDQILKLDLPTSTGASRVLTNVGELSGKGIEVGINAHLLTGKVKWNTTLNASHTTTKVSELIPGVDQLVFRDLEGGAIRVIAEKNQSIGNIYVYPRKTDDNGNYIINNDGLYVIDKTRYVKAGNLMPQITGGFFHTLAFKNFTLNMGLDYSLGGKIISPPMKYAIGAGLYENTLQYRDSDHGGITYYINSNGDKVQLQQNATAPHNEPVYHDGVILNGVTEEGIENTKIIESATYYLNTFGWGNDSWNEKGAIYDNSYVKLREATLSYNLPQKTVDKLHFQKMQISLVGRNLLYLWRTLENLDSESTIGTSWLNQGIDQGSNAANRSYGFAIKLSF